MGDQVNSLRKENEELTKQILEVQKELNSIKKISVSKGQHGGSTGARSKEQFGDLTDQYGRPSLAIAQSSTSPK